MRQSRLGSWFTLWLTFPFFTFMSPLQAAASSPVGTLQCEGKVYLGSDLARSSSVVYAGDRLRIDEGRATLSFPRGDLLVVTAHSDVTLQNAADGYLVKLEKGHLVFATPSKSAVLVETDGLILAPQGNTNGLAEIALRGDGSVVVAVQRGAISVAHLRKEPVIVESGKILTVSRSQDQPKQAQQPGTGAHGKPTLAERLRTFRIDGLTHNASVALLVVGVGGAATAAVVVPISIREAPVSPSAP